MHVIYKTVAPGEVDRIIAYCSHHNVKNGGLFEVYPGADGGLVMVIVNSCSESGPQGKLRPLGAFYLNYSGPGVISIEEEDPHFDGAESRKRVITSYSIHYTKLYEMGLGVRMPATTSAPWAFTMYSP